MPASDRKIVPAPPLLIDPPIVQFSELSPPEASSLTLESNCWHVTEILPPPPPPAGCEFGPPCSVPGPPEALMAAL